MNFDWNELAFGSKKPLNELNAIFIAAPREISPARFKQLIKQYLPQGNIILGLAKEPYVLGLENQPQFRTLNLETAQPLINKVNVASSSHRIFTLSYSQRDLPFIFGKLKLHKIILVNGSWRHAFHLRPEYYILAQRQIAHEFVSPFTDEAEARAVEKQIKLPELPNTGDFTAGEMLGLAQRAAAHSFDNGFQTGVALGLKRGDTYRLLATASNRVVPFQTYAWHYGAARERNFSPMNDLNHYDTNHAEVDFMVKAVREHLDLRDTTLFINLLPCPTCARMLSATDIAEFVYREDHSAGYAIRMLELADKTVRRLT